MPYYYEVIPFSQINEGLTYQSNEQIPLGSIVQIPLRKKLSQELFYLRLRLRILLLM